VSQILGDVVDGVTTTAVFNLETGEPLAGLAYSKLNPGSFIFWKCLEIIRETPLEELQCAELITVNEPGKARTVTKGKTAIKIVFDAINKICSDVLSKTFSSSEAGMKMSDHMWKVFRGTSTETYKEEFYTTAKAYSTKSGKSNILDVIFKNVFASSTDYKEATDRVNVHLARILANFWMDICGIPPILKGIVNACSFEPRKIFFSATGYLTNFGEPDPDNSRRRFIRMTRGLLMGDPFTKPNLHLINIIVRDMSDHID
jgi:hypothetical protein